MKGPWNEAVRHIGLFVDAIAESPLVQRFDACSKANGGKDLDRLAADDAEHLCKIAKDDPKAKEDTQGKLLFFTNDHHKDSKWIGI